MMREVDGEIVILPPDVRLRWEPPDSYDQLTAVAAGTLKISQLNSALSPSATVREGRGLANSG